MKISKNAPVEKAEYEIESGYGSLECVFYPEKVYEFFYENFRYFAKDEEDFQSIKPFFEQYIEKSMEIFAEHFQKRLKDLMKESAEEAVIKTVTEIKDVTRKEAKQLIKDALKIATEKKKERMNAPNAGRPAEWSKDTLRKAVIDEIKKWKNEKRRDPTLNDIGKRLKPPVKSDALRMLLVRHGLEWKELKNEHN
jgi:hypothetical protein